METNSGEVPAAKESPQPQFEHAHLQALVHNAITADGLDPKADDLSKKIGSIDLIMLNGKNRNWGAVVSRYDWGTILRLYYFTTTAATLRTTFSWSGMELRLSKNEDNKGKDNKDNMELLFDIGGITFSPTQLIEWRMWITNPLSNYASISEKKILERRAINLSTQGVQFVRFSSNHKWLMTSLSKFDPTVFLFRCRRGDLIPELVAKHTLAANHYLDWNVVNHPNDPIKAEARLCSWETIEIAGGGTEKSQKTFDLDDDSDSHVFFLPLDSHDRKRQEWFDTTVSNRDVQKLVWNHLFFFTDF